MTESNLRTSGWRMLSVPIAVCLLFALLIGGFVLLSTPETDTTTQKQVTTIVFEFEDLNDTDRFNLYTVLAADEPGGTKSLCSGSRSETQIIYMISVDSQHICQAVGTIGGNPVDHQFILGPGDARLNFHVSRSGAIRPA